MKRKKEIHIVPVLTKESLPLFSDGEKARLTEWFETISNGKLQVLITEQKPIVVEESARRYTVSGGMRHDLPNSRTLINEIFPFIDQKTKSYSKDWGILCVTPLPFKAHTWHIKSTRSNNVDARVGVTMRYTIVPHPFTFGQIVHECGHLLFGWPDLVFEQRYRKACLMAGGALYDGRNNPALPCAPLLVHEQFISPISLTSETTVNELIYAKVGQYHYREKNYLVSVEEKNNVYLLTLFEARYRNKRPTPEIIGQERTNQQGDPVLAIVAPLLRRGYG